jgi:hypothetical protein
VRFDIATDTLPREAVTSMTKDSPSLGWNVRMCDSTSGFLQTHQGSSMAAWLIPALKAVLPHVGTIISAAVPVFTKKSVGAVANQTLLLQQQITELQTAASQNAEHIKELAAQLQSTVTALEQAASIAETKARGVRALSAVAIGLSAISLCGALVLFLAQ